MNKKAVIVSGGSIQDEFALQMLNEIQPAYVIGVDSGLAFLYRSQVEPTYIVGDFDSVDPEVIAYYKNKTDIPIREFNPVKDATDTEIGVRLALELGADVLYLFGATGTRLDHVLANIQMLKIALDAGVKAYLVDECNRISLWNEEVTLSKEESFGTYFSIFPFGDSVEKVSITGAKYPLNEYHLTNRESRCVSNEVAEEEVHITFSDGILILMETRDRNE